MSDDPKPARPPEYLGDGVYMSDDEFQIWLHVGGHLNPPVVALDKPTFDALVKQGGLRFLHMQGEG